jgi:hypothetical protein
MSRTCNACAHSHGAEISKAAADARMKYESYGAFSLRRDFSSARRSRLGTTQTRRTLTLWSVRCRKDRVMIGTSSNDATITGAGYVDT